MNVRLFLPLLGLLGCNTLIVELVPDQGASPPDVQIVDLGSDFGPSDLGSDAGPDTGALDLGSPDLGVLDLGVLDMGMPDLGAACVCRRRNCRTTQECEMLIGAGSVCDGTFTCTMGIRTCSTVRDCAADPTDWSCTIAPDSLTPCP